MKIKNGFQKFGIDHLSPSNVNKFIAAPDAWTASYLYKIKFPGSYNMYRGSAVEAGVERGIWKTDASIDECVEVAQRYFREHTRLMRDQYDEIEKHKPMIEQMVTVALEELREYGPPQKPPLGERQNKVEIPIRFKKGPGGLINAYGYLDFYFPDYNVVYDLKTTAKAPSGWPLGHGIQAAFYQKAVEKKFKRKPIVRFLYALTRKKNPLVTLELESEDADRYIQIMKRTVIGMEKLLSKFDTKQEILDVIPYNPESFYWSDARSIAAELYGAAAA